MRLVIVGNGVAGVTTARFVAEGDPSFQVTIYSDELYSYYPRPRLIELVAGQVTPEKMAFYPEEWYRKRNINVVLGHRVAGIEAQRHQIVLDDGTLVPYDKLVLAMGARSWLPPIVGSEHAGVHTLRSMCDALAIRDRAAHVEHATVLGGGLLGLDTAMGLRAQGIRVSVVEIMPRLLPRQLDAAGASLLQHLIEIRGVEVVTNDSCVSIEGRSQVERVVLKSGRTLETGMVVISAGVRSNIGMAQSAGLNCGQGVIVDERLRTSAPDIYAVGDVAEFKKRVWGIIPAALAQARVAAAQIMGKEQVLYHDIVPSTTLKVTGVDVLSIGEVNPQNDGFREASTLDLSAGIYKKLVVRDGRLVGAIVIGDRASFGAVSALIEQRAEVSTHKNFLLGKGFEIIPLLAS